MSFSLLIHLDRSRLGLAPEDEVPGDGTSHEHDDRKNLSHAEPKGQIANMGIGLSKEFHDKTAQGIPHQENN